MTEPGPRLDDAGRDALREVAADVVTSLRGEHNRRLSTRKEWRWGRFGSLSLVMAGPKQGLWHDHEAGAGGDVVEFIRAELHCSFREALDYAAGYVGELRRSPRSRPTPQTPIDSDDDDESRTVDAVEIWLQARNITGTMVEMYLRTRGITELPATAYDVLRFHPRCLWGTGTRPAMVALVRDILSDEVLGIHRTALTSDGRKLGRPKMFGPCSGGAIKLTPAGASLLIAEGVETTLSAPLLGLGSSIWSVLDAGGIRKFPVLPDVEQLTIAADHDRSHTGQNAATECKARWIFARRPVRTIISKTAGEDLNDVLQRLRGRRHG